MRGNKKRAPVGGEMPHSPTFGETYEEESKEVKRPA